MTRDHDQHDDQPPDRANDERGSGHSSWRTAELLFGGGVIVWALSTTIAGVWWAAAIDSRVNSVEQQEQQIEQQIRGLDNVSLGNRITALETQVVSTNRQLDSIERKMDRLLQRNRVEID